MYKNRTTLKNVSIYPITFNVSTLSIKSASLFGGSCSRYFPISLIVLCKLFKIVKGSAVALVLSDP